MWDQILERVNVQELVTRMITFVPGFLAGLLVLLVFWIIFRVSRPPLKGMLKRAGFHDTLIHLVVENIYRFIVLGFGVVMAADQMGMDIGAALAGLGVAGIAIGFAAQDSLANTIAGFMIFWDKPFEVGDWVTVADQYGMVRNITMRSTRIRTNQNTYVVIPNKTIIDAVLVNHSKHGETRIDVPIGIAYKEYIPEARRVILEAVRKLDRVLETPPPDVVVNQLGGSSVDLEVRVWIREAKTEQPTRYAVVEASKLALDEAGIQIPFPHLQLFVDDVEETVIQKMAQIPALGRGTSAG